MKTRKDNDADQIQVWKSSNLQQAIGLILET